MKKLPEFEDIIGYKFKDKNLLMESLRHSSYVNELADLDLNDNERFEFLGDAVLNLIISHILMLLHTDVDEGSLSQMRANLVNENQLAHVAEKLNFGNYIQLGKGEILTNGRTKKSILADAFEAVIAAIYLDGGYSKAYKIIEKHFVQLISMNYPAIISPDYKSQLQEMAQISYKQNPIYSVVSETGPDHDKTFKVLLKISEIATKGIGKSKKEAERRAAKKALKIVKSLEPK